MSLSSYRIPNPTFFAFARALPRVEGETQSETEARIAAELQTLDALAPGSPIEASFALQFVLCTANVLAQFARANAPGQTPDGMRRHLMLAASLQRGGERALAMLLRLRTKAPASRLDPHMREGDTAAVPEPTPEPAPDPTALAEARRAASPTPPEPAGSDPLEPCWLWQKGHRRNIHEMSDEELRDALRDMRDGGLAPRPGG